MIIYTMLLLYLCKQNVQCHAKVLFSLMTRFSVPVDEKHCMMRGGRFVSDIALYLIAKKSFGKYIFLPTLP